jgi:hypothetical protein
VPDRDRVARQTSPALPQDVRAILFDGVAGLFFRVMPWRLKKRCRPAIETARPISDRVGAQFLKRDVSVGLPKRKNVACAFLDAMRAHVAALGLRLEVADIAPLCMPADGRRRRNTKSGRCRPATHPVINRGYHPRAQIH